MTINQTIEKVYFEQSQQRDNSREILGFNGLGLKHKEHFFGLKNKNLSLYNFFQSLFAYKVIL